MALTACCRHVLCACSLFAGGFGSLRPVLHRAAVHGELRFARAQRTCMRLPRIAPPCPALTLHIIGACLQAVHSENTKNLQNDMWRLYQLSKSTSKPDHAYHKFGTGNLETLKDTPEVRGCAARVTRPHAVVVRACVFVYIPDASTPALVIRPRASMFATSCSSSTRRTTRRTSCAWPSSAATLWTSWRRGPVRSSLTSGTLTAHRRRSQGSPSGLSSSG